MTASRIDPDLHKQTLRGVIHHVRIGLKLYLIRTMSHDTGWRRRLLDQIHNLLTCMLQNQERTVAIPGVIASVNLLTPTLLQRSIRSSSCTSDGSLDRFKKTSVNDARAAASNLVATTLTVALLIAQYSHLPILIEDSRTVLRGTSGTISQAISLEIRDIDLFQQINRIYDDLLKNQKDLDAESKYALYSNLWDLYS